MTRRARERAPRPRTSTAPGSRGRRRSARRAARARASRPRGPVRNARAAGAADHAGDQRGCPRAGGARPAPPPSRRRSPRRRSAAAAGSVCTTSPIADRRTSERLHRAELLEELPRVVVLGIAHDGHSAAVRPHHLALGDRLGGVVRPLAVDVGPQGEEQPRSRRPPSNTTTWSTARSAATSSARSRLRQHRPAGALEPPHRVVAVDAHDEHVRLRPARPRGSGRARRAARRSSRWRGRPSGPARALARTLARDLVERADLSRAVLTTHADRRAGRGDRRRGPQQLRARRPWPSRASSPRCRPRSWRGRPPPSGVAPRGEGQGEGRRSRCRRRPSRRPPGRCRRSGCACVGRPGSNSAMPSLPRVTSTAADLQPAQQRAARGLQPPRGRGRW